MKIIVDTMGSDEGAKVIVQGAIDALEENDISIILVGNEEEISEKLNTLTYDKSKVEIINANETITNDDDPVSAIRKKKESSMVIGANLLKDGKGDGFLSTGNTGALLASGLFIVGRIDGVDRAAISAPYPSLYGGTSFLLDSGANVDVRPDILKQFGVMGSIYMEKVFNIPSPTVGLINIGVEKTKGNKLAKETYKLLEASDLNFVGNVEARDLPKTDVDVLISDGFIGNIVLKLTEGMAIAMLDFLKEILSKDFKTKLAAGLLKDELLNMKQIMDYREYGGAPLLGISKPLFKAHGSSDEVAIKNAIKQMVEFNNLDIINLISKEINKEEA